ncbi:MAG: hypothetical protein GXP56_04615 [Deltaproteobacteria bacterium]|nr:hypothetical protein [Deltaproteobacteria bacterium]
MSGSHFWKLSYIPGNAKLWESPRQSQGLTQYSYAFKKGYLDIPFGASRFNRSNVLPLRNRSGAIRIYETGNLPFSVDVIKKIDNTSNYILYLMNSNDRLPKTKNLSMPP